MTILSAVAALLTVAAAVTILVARSRRAGLMIYAVMSVLAAVLFSLLGAYTVALIELGAGLLGTVLFLITLNKIRTNGNE